MSDDSASDDSPDSGRDAGKVVEEPTGDDDGDDDDTGSVAPPDSGPRGAVNSGRDSGTAAQPKDAGASPAPSTPDSGSSAAVDSGSGSSSTPPRDSGTASGGTADSGSGGGSSTDSGSSSGGSTAGQCATTPAYPTADACSQCICAKCSSQVAACYASGETAKDQQCALVQACAEQNHCTSTNCYCGDADLLCLFPAGPCVDVIQTAAGSTSGLDILSVSNDTTNPVGRANQIGLCVNDNCPQECGL